MWLPIWYGQAVKRCYQAISSDMHLKDARVAELLIRILSHERPRTSCSCEDVSSERRCLIVRSLVGDVAMVSRNGGGVEPCGEQEQ